MKFAKDKALTTFGWGSFNLRLNVATIQIVLTCCLLMFQFSSAHANLFNGEAYSSGNPDTEFRLHYAKALNGDSTSQLRIGQIFLEGKGSTEKNAQRALAFINESIKSGNARAARYLAEEYERGKFIKKDICVALSNYEKAQKLGSSSLASKILNLSQQCRGAVSASSCALYGLNDLSRAKTLAQCAEKGYITAKASGYWIAHFDQGNASSLLNAAQVLIDPSSAEYQPMEIVKRLPKFFMELASDEQKLRMVSIVKAFGHASASCKSEKNAMGLVDDGDPPSCFLAAATGELKAMEFASSWWKEGKHGVLRNEAYGESMLSDVLNQNPSELDIERLLAAMEDDPRKHFSTAMRYLEENPFNRDRVSLSLALEMGLIASGDIPSFASTPEEVGKVLEIADWNAQSPTVIASVLFKLRTEFADFPQLKTASIQANINKLQFKSSWMNELVFLDLSNGKSISKSVLEQFVGVDCKAVEFGVMNSQLVDQDSFIDLPNRRNCLQFDAGWMRALEKDNPDMATAMLSKFLFESCDAIKFGLENTQLLNQEALNVSPIYEECTASGAANQNILTIDFSKDPARSAALLLTKFKGETEEQCEAFLIFLRNKSAFSKNVLTDNLPDMIVNELESQLACAKISGGVAEFLAKDQFVKGKFGNSFENAKNACEMKSYDACGLAAYLVLKKSIPQNKGLDKLGEKRRAINLAERGFRVGNSALSGLVLHDALTHGVTGVVTNKKEDLEKLLADLRPQSPAGVKLRVQGKCLKGFFKGCKEECLQIDRLVDSGELDYISEDLGKEYQSHRKCN